MLDVGISGVGENVNEQTKEFENFLIVEIGQCDRPPKEVDDKRAEPLEGISKFHSIWISSNGELRGEELSCDKCSISIRCSRCNEPRQLIKKKSSGDKFKCTFCPKSYVHEKTWKKHILTHE